MVLLKAMIGAALGGAIGAAIWAGIAYGTGYEIGWIAWGVGVLAGGGALLFVRSEASAATGAVAAGVAILALAAGRYASVSLTIDDTFTKKAVESFHITTEDMLVQQATDLADEWEGEGRTLKWPEGMSNEDADKEADFPKDVWKEATTRWEAKSPEEQKAAMADAEASLAQAVQTFRSAVVREGFMSSFDLMDVLFCGLALVTAFRVGAGVTGRQS